MEVCSFFVFEGYDMVDPGLYELVEKILWAVSFITIGGTLAVMFFFIFAQRGCHFG